MNATNEHDDKNFSRYVIKRLPAEVAADAIRLATGSSERVEKFANNMDTRMIGNSSVGNCRSRSANYMLGIFGKPQRENNCDCERTVDPHQTTRGTTPRCSGFLPAAAGLMNAART